MLTKALCIAAVLGALTVSSQEHYNSTRGEASVEIRVFSTNGVSLYSEVEVLEFIEDGTRTDLATRFRNGEAAGIPFSTYRVKVNVLGFYPESRYVRVFQDHVTVIMGLMLAEEAGPPVSIEGRVIGLLPLGKINFVRAIGVYSNLSAESLIAADGRFRFSQIPDGDYILLVVNEDGILASRKVRLPDRLEIDLEKHGFLR